MPTLFLDLDGVLADFDAHVRNLFGAPPSSMPPSRMWGLAAKSPGFFETMPPMPDAHELWDFSRPFEPRILSGLPRGSWAEDQKRRWVRVHLGPHVHVTTCMSRDKCEFAAPGDVLVDDTPKYAHLWEARGGIFVPHTSAADSITALRELGFEPDETRPDARTERESGLGRASHAPERNHPTSRPERSGASRAQ